MAMATKSYHLLLKDREITDLHEIKDIFQSQAIVTIAMCQENIPYLVTMDYVYVEEEHAIYFHCAKKGKKMDYLTQNPMVWGQILEDLGYITGECSHAYRSVHFKGQVSFVEELESKKNIFGIMIKRFESNPEPLVKRFIENKQLKGVKIGKITLKKIIGKKNIK